MDESLEYPYYLRNFIDVDYVIYCNSSAARDSFKFATKYLGTFSEEDASNIVEAKEEAVHAIIKFVKVPDMFQVLPLLTDDCDLDLEIMESQLLPPSLTSSHLDPLICSLGESPQCLSSNCLPFSCLVDTALRIPFFSQHNEHMDQFL